MTEVGTYRKFAVCIVTKHSPPLAPSSSAGIPSSSSSNAGIPSSSFSQSQMRGSASMSALKWLGKNCPYRSSVELHSGVAVIVRVEYTLPQAMPKSKPWRRELGQSVPRIVTCGATQVKFAAGSDFQSQASGVKKHLGRGFPWRHSSTSNTARRAF